MANVRILTDSLADIPPQVMKELNITAVPAVVQFGEKVYRDRVDLFPKDFYKLLTTSPEVPRTSQPSIGVFEEAYRKLARETDQILAIHTVAALSGIYNSSRLAAENIQSNSRIAARNIKGPRIEMIDSQQVTMSLGWLVILAARAAKEGRSLNEVCEVVKDAFPRVHIVAMLDTLEYAQRSGRLGKGQALVGTLLHVKPLLSIVSGEIVPVENVRSQKRALERLVEIVLGSGPIQELAVVHAEALDYAKKLHSMLAETFPKQSILMSETGPVLGTHVGPGGVGIAWVSGKY